MRILLFDIDGTLIRCGGAGGMALMRALELEFALDTVTPVPISGRTDLGIVNNLFANHGIESSHENRERLYQRYFSLLPSRLAELSQNAQAHELPGVRHLLEQLRTDTRFLSGLVTGNLPVSARIKLQHFALEQFFSFGVFGDSADHRPNLATPILQTVHRHIGSPCTSEQMVIIGDTPLDVQLAMELGCRSLAVCTGGCNAAELQEAGADLVLHDLSDTAQVMNFLAA